MYQYERVLQYMKDFGSITTMQAFKDLGCTRLPAVIFKLKEKGYAIDKERQFGKNRYGDKCHWDRYFLAGDNDGE